MLEVPADTNGSPVPGILHPLDTTMKRIVIICVTYNNAPGFGHAGKTIAGATVRHGPLVVLLLLFAGLLA